ncbi:hypothetical protein A2303_04915 [Candidatus Falkowbacteria bacterium RIFOXYB2_FULL_47_14]|uniref:Nudix hydrolase domain-containing protein n=1 Tax=Candidatus Falkowbacteria bacterium RIFOXYA2_FULL_47_19 TaxID=1797994 RepID=A0A1F5SI44_9BACT|nr:MAG: hypothetical protein A2227_02750 [Candidatus Falkowbacteria bacterium RIFOXYA2_FULL_47_19]OGF34327.1 MAG: hypothetical protein A2468_04255 [Candidatus Falkowbacteria bacterium RIFOXYC2_FULL_46_15]OGF42716.1 MAG: hypothetical protein A2303_04915 [Candidatus Falkowbacteria bacterium RIFOXYB2_FULL_47_14]
MAIEYYNNLPKKRIGAGVIILNGKEEVLIVKPGYKDHWSIVGGVVDENESPLKAARRETKEEIGIELKDARFLCVDHVLDNGKGESLQFIFYGGKLDEEEIKKIKIDGKEIVEYKFVKTDDALRLLSENSRIRLSKCFKALKNDTAIYSEGDK